MSRVISKDMIKSWNDKNKINQLKHTKSLSKEASPKPIMKLRGSRGGRRTAERGMDPERMINILGKIRNNLPNQSFADSPPCPYNEYKDSIKKTTTTLLSAYAGQDNSDSVRDKLQNSSDIASILSNKVGSINFVENEWAVLCLTVLGKFAEARCGV